jgi:hypothetical protein
MYSSNKQGLRRHSHGGKNNHLSSSHKQPSARNRGRAKGEATAAQQPPHQIKILKKRNLVDMIILNALCDLPFSQNQPLK